MPLSPAPSCRVYPRACGGTSTSTSHSGTPAGLSPRLRGNRHGATGQEQTVRSIPAPAGEPPTRTSPRNRTAVYPRACGGTPLLKRMCRGPHGLSPRLRGNRLRTSDQGRPRTVYPRACGGTPGPCGCLSTRIGLSPRLRGNPLATHIAVVRPRSIPAPAGEPISSGLNSVHEKGLSPRLRGNLALFRRLHVGVRSIPAPAGEPAVDTLVRECWAVYPRACGGTYYYTTAEGEIVGLSPRLRGNLALRQQRVTNRTGLSPRLRGNPAVRALRRRSSRSIPAPAGEPTPHPMQARTAWVYPRACGGTCLTTSTRSPSTGLSPRLRGNLETASGG